MAPRSRPANPLRNETITVRSGKLTPNDIAQAVFEAVRDERLYIITHPRILGAVQARMEDLLTRRNPRNPLAIRPQ